jgi:hypothetical protein
MGERFVYRDDEPSQELVEMDRPWSFDGDGDLLRLVSGAQERPSGPSPLEVPLMVAATRDRATEIGWTLQ